MSTPHEPREPDPLSFPPPDGGPYGAPSGGGYAPYQGVSYGPGVGEPAESAGPAYEGATSAPSPAVEPPPGERRIGWIGVGLLYLLAIWQLVIPSVSTLRQSLSSGNPFLGGESELVGLANFADVAPQLVESILWPLGTMLMTVVAAMAIGLAIGTAMPALSRTSTPVRVLVGVTGALFVPLGVGLARYASGTGDLSDPAGARTFLLVTIALAWLPLLTAVFATAFGAALAPTARGGRTTGVVITIGLLAAVAAGLQVIELPLLLTNGGPDRSTTTPLLLVYQLAFMNMDMGTSAAVAAVVLLIAGVLGLIAVAQLAMQRVRLVLDRPDPSATPRSGLLGLVVAVAVLGLAVVTVWRVLVTSATGSGTTDLPVTEAALTTWLPVALGTLVQVLVALMGGLAIGWCRPLGRASLWLLLPLAPWVFVGPGGLMVATFEQARSSGSANTWFALVPQPFVVVGAVTVLALLLFGLREQTARIPAQPVLALTAGVAAVLLVVQGQSALRSLILVTDPDLLTTPALVRMAMMQFGMDRDAVPWGLLYPIPVLLIVAALAVLAQLGLRRVALVRG